MSTPRIRKDIQTLKENGYTVQFIEGKYGQETIIVGFTGPQNSPYEDGIFYVQFSLSQFPFKGPNARLKTPIYHPFALKYNFNELIPQCFFIDCSCCVNHLRPNGWKPTYKLIELVETVRNFMKDPLVNPKEWEKYGFKNETQYEKRAKMFTEKFAVSDNYKGFEDNLKSAQGYGFRAEIEQPAMVKDMKEKQDKMTK